MRSPTLAPVEIDYPTEDGLPMAENDAQGIALMYAVTGLRDYFRHRSDVYVSGNLLIYYEEGNPNASVAPDAFVVFGVPNHPRPIYRVWEEGKSPDFVLEIASPSTWDKDLGPKRDLYESLGVREYWQYDPTGGDFLEPPLRGMHLLGGEYVPMPPPRAAAGALVMHSAVLGLDVCLVRGELRFRDPMTGQNILTLTESNEERHRAEDERQQAEHARQQAEQAQQQAEQAQQQAEDAQQQEKQARQRAEHAQQQEKQARIAAEVRLERELARVAELRALLAQRQEQDPERGGRVP